MVVSEQHMASRLTWLTGWATKPRLIFQSRSRSENHNTLSSARCGSTSGTGKLAATHTHQKIRHTITRAVYPVQYWKAIVAGESFVCSVDAALYSPAYLVCTTHMNNTDRGTCKRSRSDQAWTCSNSKVAEQH